MVVVVVVVGGCDVVGIGDDVVGCVYCCALVVVGVRVVHADVVDGVGSVGIGVTCGYIVVNFGVVVVVATWCGDGVDSILCRCM